MEEARQRGIVDEDTARICWLEQPSPSSSSSAYSYSVCSRSKQTRTVQLLQEEESYDNCGVGNSSSSTFEHVDCVARASLLRQNRRERIRQTVASMAA